MLFSEAPPTEGPLLADRYRLISRIGEGGMAGVYRAWDERLRVWRAAKVLLPEFATKKKLRIRFEREAHTMARLEHPNLVRVVDVGNSGQLPFIVMELVPSGTLMQWLERHGPMPSRLAVSSVLQVCEGLAEVHRNNVVHRDIKPHNVLINEHGVLKLTDFGIAQQADEDLTRAGSVMGTMGYMAPEQRNDASTVDQRADIYGMGATLWKLLTDKPVRDLFMYGEDSSILDGLDEGLAEVLRACLAYQRDQRPDSITEIADALTAVLEELPEDPYDTPPLPLDGVLEKAEERAKTFEEIALAFVPHEGGDEGPKSTGGVGSASPATNDLVAPKSYAGLPYGLPRKLETESWVSYDEGPVDDVVDDPFASAPTPSAGVADGGARLGGAIPAGFDLDEEEFAATQMYSDEQSASGAAPLYLDPPEREKPVEVAPPPRAEAAAPAAAPGLDPALMIRLAAGILVVVVMTAIGVFFWSRAVVTEAAEAAIQANNQFYIAMDQERNVVSELVAIERGAQALEGLYLVYMDHPLEPERWNSATKFVEELGHYAKAAEATDSAMARQVQQRVTRLQASHAAAESAKQLYVDTATGFPGVFAASLGMAPRP